MFVIFREINTCMYIYIYLEPVCPLFLGLNPPNEGPFHSKQGSVGFQVYIIIYIYKKPKRKFDEAPGTGRCIPKWCQNINEIHARCLYSKNKKNHMNLWCKFKSHVFSTPSLQKYYAKFVSDELFSFKTFGLHLHQTRCAQSRRDESKGWN